MKIETIYSCASVLISFGSPLSEWVQKNQAPIFCELREKKKRGCIGAYVAYIHIGPKQAVFIYQEAVIESATGAVNGGPNILPEILAQSRCFVVQCNVYERRQPATD